MDDGFHFFDLGGLEFDDFLALFRDPLDLVAVDFQLSAEVRDFLFLFALVCEDGLG
jgi:hypothetical protein